MESQPDQAPLIVIVGETASGKTALGLRLAQHFSGEIIAADSWTVYKDFTIGTAKPTAEERALVRHHLLDIADPNEGFSAPLFKRYALAAMADITNRGKIPFLVGGTGLYIDSVLFDYQFLSAPSSDERARLSALSTGEVLASVRERGLDTSGVDIRNKRRLIRLLETNGAQPQKAPMRSNTLVLGMQVDRDHLRDRVVLRVDDMFRRGLEQEVAALSEKYGWDVEPMKGIGYREWYEYFHGSQTLEQTRARIISATMNLAKRQRTWFKRNNSIHWLTTEDKFTEAVDIATTFLNK